MAAKGKKYDEEPETSKARNDAYTGMLLISLLALATGGVLLYLDYSQYPDKKPPAVSKVAPEAAVPAGGGDQPKAKEPAAAEPKQDAPAAPAKEPEKKEG